MDIKFRSCPKKYYKLLYISIDILMKQYLNISIKLLKK